MNDSGFPLPTNAYLAFDGLTIKDKITQRLNQSGVFSDQNFQGSNLSSINDTIAMIFSLLLYNLNKTASEGQFTEAQLYENMNRIVKQWDYKPVGHQTANVSYSVFASTLNAGIYTIPRYSFISVGGIKYSFTDDFSFTKTTSTILESIDNTNDNILYQGSFIEYPLYTPAGNDNEIIYLTANDTAIIDNINIHVYLKPINGKWSRWQKTQSLFLNNANDQVFEIRFNEKKHYELKFGNNINGKGLQSTDSVAIYYLQSDGELGQIGASTLQGKKASIFNTNQLTSILTDLQTYSNYLNNFQLGFLSFDNSCISTSYSQPEDVASIRRNAPAAFRSQFSVITPNSYETFVRSNFGSIIRDVVCMNNTDYLNSYIKYFYDLGLTKPQLESRALFNQTKFADSCNFNNVYLFVVPRTISSTLSYLVPAQKSLIIETLDEEKILTSETIIMDPVYVAVDLATSDSNTIVVDDVNFSNIYVEKVLGSRRSDDSIKQDIQTIILDYFAASNIVLGQTININDLSNQLLGIAGVKKLYTQRTDTGTIVPGIRFISWNPVYPDPSVALIVGNTTLEVFQFPYLFNTNFIDRIVVENTFSNVETII